MKNLFSSIFVALIMVVMASAQDKMTMEEAVLGKDVAVEKFVWHWTGDGDIFAPGENKVEEPAADFAFTRGNNLYYKDPEGNEIAVTQYGAEEDIVCGQAVSRHEFGIEDGIFRSPDGSRIAFYRKDESRVTDYPLVDIFSRTGGAKYIKYPMNGMASEIVSVGVYDIASGNTCYLEVTDFDEERYLTNVTWNPSGDKIYIQVLDREQKHMHLNCYDAVTGGFLGTLFTEENSRFIEPQSPLVFLKNDSSRFIYFTDNRDGYKNLYIGSVEGGEPIRLTKVDADVEYVAQDGKYVYYYSFEVSPVERHLFRVNLKKGAVQRLTVDKGWHNCTFSADRKYFMDEYSSIDVPSVAKLISADGRKVREVFRAPMPPDRAVNCIIETGTIKSADGLYDNHYSLVKPADFDPSKKYPMVLYVYGGPHLQQITDRFQGGMNRWDILMAQKGYVVFKMDNRGTPNRGAEYEKAIHKFCGKAEMADQMVGVRWMMSQPWIDSSRIGVHGWSYGGFMTISLMTNYPEVFKVGVAGGPVIDWKWYEVMYGERYMETEATNPEGFAATSLVPMAEKIEGKLLICQGVIDDTVVWQHSLNFVESCIKNGVQVDYFPYPGHPHNVRGKDRVHLMDKVTAYFDDYLR
ncbi:MAG: DPP IV N-terminal domain-containing protein [Bacteroidales bacterium]|nr:DPP IV N-terminal domain-containing protein [Candidatus Cacconaster merdequi]